ncbi:MAG: acetylxylan esterase [Acidobacteria bacterium]|nr:acetylxylan esterase [Acidobacteriota bacterium]
MRYIVFLITLRLGAQPEVDRYLNDLAARAMARRTSEISTLTRDSLTQRQAAIRQKILASIGGLPTTKAPLNPRITGTFKRQGYRVENVIFESLPKFYVTANLYLPDSGSAPHPALIGVAGHSANGKASATYQHVWITLAKRGFVVLAIDPMGQGERSEMLDDATGLSRPGIGTAEHTTSGLQCLLAGNHIARYEIYDGMRSLDYLLTRKEVDPARIAVAGNSGGGTQSAYLAALEPRLAAAVSSCYMTSWHQLWTKPGPQDAEQVFPNFLRDGLDFADFAFSFAPRPFLMTTAIQDFFPIDGARAAYQEIRSAYTTQDAAAKAGYFEYDDTHGWSKPRREAAYRWLEKWLLGRDAAPQEDPVETEPEQLLYATATGQLRTSMGGETTQSLNAKDALAIHARRTATRSLDRSTVINRAAIPAAAPAFHNFTLHLPRNTSGKAPAIIALNATKEDLADLHASGSAILSAQFAISTVGRSESGYTSPYQMASRAFVLGQTVVGLQTADLLRVIAELKANPAIDASRIRIYARGNSAVAALHAAYLSSDVQSLATEAMPLSWFAITQARMHRGLPEIIIPGVLKDYDLPDLARAIAPRKLLMVDTRDPMGIPLLMSKVKAEYPRAEVRYRPEGWRFSKVYQGW